MDFIGSQIAKLDIDGGEVELNNGLGMTLLWQRGWKRDGLPPPQQGMATATATAMPT
eukprot:CAMPEP_0114688670 /NCGR_PEP_ID=MMETSP0191-20121206/63718_1 /TAXON_ID=126664 /ORGANISM="Sorites sp." /LENGTH=56 /DNA_ID=CAMNT_0001976401 /DNA_START=9 /DNA_END=175 /DNA_ORIENTATION=+